VVPGERRPTPGSLGNSAPGDGYDRAACAVFPAREDVMPAEGESTTKLRRSVQIARSACRPRGRLRAKMLPRKFLARIGRHC